MVISAARAAFLLVSLSLFCYTVCMGKLNFSVRFCRKCLYSSFSVEDMVLFAETIEPGYDIYKRLGLREGQPIIAGEAASRITTDMLLNGLYIDFVELLVDVDTNGYMGHQYDLRGLDDVIDDVVQAGYSFDKTTGQFFENQRERITRNWGRLREGDERQMAVLRLDIAGNSVLVRENPKNLIDQAYGDMRKMVTRAVVSRLGRLWSWEGDGALGVFMLGDYSRMAIFAGMEILNEMLLYNKMHNPLNSEIKIRLAVHSGEMVYSDSETECLRADVVKKAVGLESRAAVPNSLVISGGLAMTQDQTLLNVFSGEKLVSGEKVRLYQVEQERV
jgi:class 3 adenylate cyclase